MKFKTNNNESRFATEEEIKALYSVILKGIKDDNLRIFKEKTTPEDDFETYLMWRDSLVYVVFSVIKTEKIDYSFYFCNFINKESNLSGLITQLIYRLEDGKFIDVSLDDLLFDDVN